MTARLLGEAIDHAEAQAAALAYLLGGEEGLESVLHCLLVHADAGIQNREEHILAQPDIGMSRRVIVVDPAQS